jgi:hypothetical protein
MKHGHQNPVARPDDQMARMHSGTSAQERSQHQFSGGLPKGLDPEIIQAKPTATVLGTIKHTVAHKRRQRDQIVVRQEAEQ